MEFPFLPELHPYKYPPHTSSKTQTISIELTNPSLLLFFRRFWRSNFFAPLSSGKFLLLSLSCIPFSLSRVLSHSPSMLPVVVPPPPPSWSSPSFSSLLLLCPFLLHLLLLVLLLLLLLIFVIIMYNV